MLLSGASARAGRRAHGAAGTPSWSVGPETYPLYGVRYWIQQTITVLTNSGFTRLLGDSVFVTGFLSALGYGLRPVEQTGSNFGLIMKHATPYLSFVGTGTMISDGLTLANVDYSSTSFRMGRVSVGRRNFLGNHITMPVSSRVGDNCLIATRAMVPIDGPVRHDVGLLGSPAFEIPRSVQRDARFDRFRQPDELRRRLRAKTRHNVISIRSSTCSCSHSCSSRASWHCSRPWTCTRCSGSGHCPRPVSRCSC